MKLKIESIHNQGSNSEYVKLKVYDTCNLRDHMIMDNTYEDDGDKSNLNRHAYRFPIEQVYKGETVILYTGKGTNNIPTENQYNRGMRTLNLYWGLDNTIWNIKGDTATLLEISDEGKYTYNQIR